MMIYCFVDSNLKTTENRRLGPEERHNAPRAFEMCIGHDLTKNAPRPFLMRPVHA